MDSTVLYAVIGIVLLIVVVALALNKRPLIEGKDKDTVPPARPARKRDHEERSPSSAPTPVLVKDPSTRPRAPSGAPGARDSASREAVETLQKGMNLTRTGFIARIRDAIAGKTIDPSLIASLEEVMITSDVGVATTTKLIERLKGRLDRKELADPSSVWAALRDEATQILDVPVATQKATPLVILMVGVNGVGKTTTIGKLATRYVAAQKTVLLGAGDTFRAAAAAQLEVWGKRVHCEVVRGKDGSDPGAVAFEATTKAKDTNKDILLVDTAGRLHTKSPLMDEIKKVKRTIGKAMEGAPHEVWLVLDATTGQNALTQARMFQEAVNLTGIVLTKMDGTAKGGILLAICDELKVPVRFVGLGERAEDLREFSPVNFAHALFGDPENE